MMGFTPAQVRTMETAGISAFAKMTPAQLVAQGFAKGTTGAVASQTVMTDILRDVRWRSRGATVMQLLNSRGILANKQSQIVASENPVAYNSALKLAFSEPQVQMNMFGQALHNLTIEVVKDLTPTLVGSPSYPLPSCSRMVRKEQVGDRSSTGRGGYRLRSGYRYEAAAS